MNTLDVKRLQKIIEKIQHEGKNMLKIVLVSDRNQLKIDFNCTFNGFLDNLKGFRS